MKPKYTYEIERGEHLGTWQYHILAPDGTVWGYGARRDTKKGTEAHIKQIIRRLNGELAPMYNNLNPEEAAASRRRGQLANKYRARL